jgi:uncharacterized protein
MSPRSNVELVKEAYAAFAAGELKKLLDLMSPDIVWKFPPSNSIPWAGTFAGPGEVTKFFAALTEYSVLEVFEPLHYVAAADRVVVLGRERIRVKSTGLTYASEWAHAVTVLDGKIAAFREYTDTAAIANAFGKG